MTFDVEKLMSELVTLAQANLNTRLQAIATEKSDSVGVPLIQPEAWFFQDFLNEKAMVYNNLIFYGLEDPVADGIGPYTAEKHTLYFIAVFKETAEGPDFTIKLMRYARALKELFERDYANNSGSVKLAVSSISPTRFESKQGEVQGAWRCAGVRIETVIA